MGIIKPFLKEKIDICHTGTEIRGGKYFLFPDAQIAVVIKTSTGKK